MALQQLVERVEVEGPQLLRAVHGPLERSAVGDGGEIEQRTRRSGAWDALVDG